MKRVLMVISEGFEEIEAISIVDVLRRADIDVTMAALDSIQVKGAHNITVIADSLLSGAGENFDMIVLPGGYTNYLNLLNSALLGDMLRSFKSKDKFVCAICASPGVLAKAGVLNGHKATIYPGMESELGTNVFKDSDIVASGRVITGRGPATAITFSLELVRALKGESIADEISGKMCVR